MDVLVINESLPGESFLHVFAIAIHLLGKLNEYTMGQILDGSFYGEGLQRFTEIVKLFRLLQSNFFAGKTAIRQKGDITFLHETGQGFSDRRPADAQTFAEFLVVKLLTRQDLIAQD